MFMSWKRRTWVEAWIQLLFFVGLLQTWMTTSSQCWAVKNWNQNPNDAQLLSCWITFLPAHEQDQSLKGPSAPHPAVLLDNGLEINWRQHWQKRWSQNARLAKLSFPVSGYQPIGLRGGRRGDTPNRCCLLHPTEMGFVFSSYSWWGWNSCSLSLRGEKKVQNIRYIVRIKIVSEKEWKFKKKNGRVNVIGANGRQWEI